MEIITDKAQGKAVIVADAYELHLLHSAQWWATTHWYEKANKDLKDDIQHKADISIADAHSNIGQQLANANIELNYNQNTEE